MFCLLSLLQFWKPNHYIFNDLCAFPIRSFAVVAKWKCHMERVSHVFVIDNGTPAQSIRINYI